MFGKVIREKKKLILVFCCNNVDPVSYILIPSWRIIGCIYLCFDMFVTLYENTKSIELPC